MKKAATDREHLRLRRIQGQVSGIEKMILEQRTCSDVVIQIRAVTAALKSLEASVLERHVKISLKDAMDSRDPGLKSAKIAELSSLYERFIN